MRYWLTLLLSGSLMGIAWSATPEPPELPATDIPVTLSLADGIADLAVLTGWEMQGWPPPQLKWATVEALMPLVGGPAYGAYDAESNTAWLTPSCATRPTLLLEGPQHCRAVLLHELVHWAQYHQNGQKFAMGANEAEATYWKEQYAAKLLGISPKTLQSPPASELSRWPEPLLKLLTGAIAVSEGMTRVLVKDDAGHMQVLYLRQMVWRLHQPNWYRIGQFWFHNGHLFMVELFEEKTKHLLHAWADAGYVPAKALPHSPSYTGQWVEVQRGKDDVWRLTASVSMTAPFSR